MTVTLPSLAKLKPNTAYASLPLFDHTGWKRVRFGDVENLKVAGTRGSKEPDVWKFAYEALRRHFSRSKPTHAGLAVRERDKSPLENI